MNELELKKKELELLALLIKKLDEVREQLFRIDVHLSQL